MENTKNNITINGNVTVNVTNSTSGANLATPIDRTNEALISNDTTLSELISILTNNLEMLKAAGEEKEKKERMEKEEKLRKSYGEDYEFLKEMEDNETDNADNHNGKDTDKETAEELLIKAHCRPGPVFLRTYVPMLARLEYESGGVIEAFNNGYCVYDNGNRKTVVWILDCCNYTYHFNPLRDREREYMKQNDELSEELLCSIPWYQAVMLRGEDQIWKNSEHPKSKGTMSDADEDVDADVKPDYHWCCGGHIETPEEYVIRVETERERRDALTEKQREVYILYYEQGMTIENIASYLGVTSQAVCDRLKYIKKKLAKNFFVEPLKKGFEKSYK